MNDDLEEKIKDYAKENGKISIPELQVKFNLCYKDVISIIDKLCQEEFMSLGDGLEYIVSADSYTTEDLLKKGEDNVFSRFFALQKGSSDNGGWEDKDNVKIDKSDRKNKFFLKVLAFCVSKNEVTLTEIKTQMGCGYISACNAADWLILNGYVSVTGAGYRNFYRALITKEQYVEKFGRQFADLYWDIDKDSIDLLKKLSRRLFFPDTDISSEDFLPKNLSLNKKPMSKNYLALFSSDFNMEKIKLSITGINAMANAVISRARNKVFVYSGEWNSGKAFENQCMEVIGHIIGMNYVWKRADAVNEAARQLVAVEHSKQGREACKVHSRVLYEFLYGKDEDYERLKLQLWTLE